MAKHPNKAVMHCTVKQIHKLINTTNKVIGGLGKNVAIYATPNPVPAVLTSNVNLLITDQGFVNNGGSEAKAKRDAQALVVYNLLTSELAYVNSIAVGDKDKILLSGFDVNNQPYPGEVPAKVVISSIVIGPTDHSVKININTTNTSAQPTSASRTLLVEMTNDPSKEENWDDVLHTTDSRNIIIEDLVRGTEYFFRISAENNKGKGPTSDPSAFVAQ